MEKIGIYGGTFNPPHTGHIQGAAYALEKLGLTRLLMVPDYLAPHKEIPAGSATPEQRLRMLRLACKDKPGLEVCDLEMRRQGRSYTYETVAQLRESYRDAELTLLMGTDMFLSFDSWRKPESILQNAALAVMYRGEKGSGRPSRRKKPNWRSWEPKFPCWKIPWWPFPPRTCGGSSPSAAPGNSWTRPWRTSSGPMAFTGPMPTGKIFPCRNWKK